MSATRGESFTRGGRAAALLALATLGQGCSTPQRLAERPPALRPVSAEAPLTVGSKHTHASATHVSNRILSALVETNGVPGMGAAVWRDGRIVWTGSAGYRDIEHERRVDEHTVFRLASVSKVFAATAAARLREQRSLDVDVPVASIVGYLPDRWPPITTAQLAAHTSGIPHYQLPDLNRGAHRFTSVREAVGVFQDRDLLFAPQTRYSYSSFGYTLLSAVVEEISGRSYLEYLSQEIVPGLQIGPDATDTRDPNAARAYEFADGAVRPAAPHDYSYSWAGAGLGATASDLARFGGRLLAGEIVSQGSLEWMLVPSRLLDGSIAMERDVSVGFGWRTGRDAEGERIAHHAGATSGARSALVLYPDRAVAASLLSNALWVSAIEQTALMLAAPFLETDPVAFVPCPTAATGYEGEFGEEPLVGTARAAVENGVCTVTITVENAFGAWLNSFIQKDAEELRIIGIDPDGGFRRAALVTPTGVFDLRAQDGDARYLAPLGGTRTVSIRFR